jgi:hypothetical protein
MGMTKAGRRIAYDRVWGSLLLLSCLIPAQLTDEGEVLRRFYVPGSVPLSAWVLSGTAAGLMAVILGFGGFRGRGRHGLNILSGCLVLAMPLVWPVIWDAFPLASPSRLPLASLGKVGVVMLLALGAVYVGAGIRVARPTHFAGSALGTVGALVVVIFACLPRAVGGSGYASARILEFRDFAQEWRALLPVVLVAAAAACSIANMVRNKFEVALARSTRNLLVGALLLVILLPFIAVDKDALAWHGPAAWGGVRFFAPLFLALDGAIAFTAISITRSQE